VCVHVCEHVHACVPDSSLHNCGKNRTFFTLHELITDISKTVVGRYTF
jgi:hypothetical protein